MRQRFFTLSSVAFIVPLLAVAACNNSSDPGSTPDGAAGDTGMGGDTNTGGSPNVDCDPETRTCSPNGAECPAGTSVAQAATETSPLTCAACAPGTFSSEPNAASCQAHRDCEPGTFVEAEGDVTKDRACAPCEEGTISYETNAAACEARCPRFTEEDASSKDTLEPVCNEKGWTREVPIKVADMSNFDDTYADAALDADGNIFVAGWATAGYEDDAVLVKYDAEGELLWRRRFGKGGFDKARRVAVDSSGNAVVIGDTIGNLFETSAGSLDTFVVKYDPDGKVIWGRQFGTGDSESTFGVDVDNNGRVLVAGSTRGDLAGIVGESDAFLRVYDVDGAVLWTRQFETSTSEYVYRARFAPDGTMFVVGVVYGEADVDAFVTKYAADGDHLWTRTFGSTDAESVSDLVVDSSGAVVVVGGTEGAIEKAAGGNDVFLVKFDAQGNEKWRRQFGSKLNEGANAVAIDASGNIVVGGSTAGDLGGEPAGNSDIYLQAYSGDGTKLWGWHYGTSSHDTLAAVDVDAGGNLIVTGTTWDNGLFVKLVE